jgi:hypothetical protein
MGGVGRSGMGRSGMGRSGQNNLARQTNVYIFSFLSRFNMKIDFLNDADYRIV